MDFSTFYIGDAIVYVTDNKSYVAISKSFAADKSDTGFML